jgi:hypothetical protein
LVRGWQSTILLLPTKRFAALAGVTIFPNSGKWPVKAFDE